MIPANLGESVRRLREASKLSLRVLAERTGFSASFLSQVENGQASPSIASMERIAEALGVTLGEFFQTAGARQSAVVRGSARATLNSGWSKARIEALGADGQNSRLEPVVVTLDPGGTSGTRPFTSRVEEFALVLEGCVVLTLHQEEQVLDCGDAVTIRAGTPRQWQNQSEAPARILVVSSR